MAALSRLLRSVEGGRVSFWCPGCDEAHVIYVEGPHAWSYNGNPDAPTFNPSVLVTGNYWEPPVTPENMEEWKRSPWPQQQVRHVCHSFVRDGQIQFLGDCTHALRGQTVPLATYPGWEPPA